MEFGIDEEKMCPVRYLATMLSEYRDSYRPESCIANQYALWIEDSPRTGHCGLANPPKEKKQPVIPVYAG